jgi:hypothetical protein
VQGEVVKVNQTSAIVLLESGQTAILQQEDVSNADFKSLQSVIKVTSAICLVWAQKLAFVGSSLAFLFMTALSILRGFLKHVPHTLLFTHVSHMFHTVFNLFVFNLLREILRATSAISGWR